jgi:phosphoribosylformylglycinamidine synthase
MKETVRRLFVEKKKGFDIEAQNMMSDLKNNLGIGGIQNLRLINRYDIEGISAEEYVKVKEYIFSEKVVDEVYDEEIHFHSTSKVFAVEFLPGQYDQRADSACQCIQILVNRDTVAVRTAKVIAVQGNINEEELIKIKNYSINPVESRESNLTKPTSLHMEVTIPNEIPLILNFLDYTKEELEYFSKEYALAMSLEDIAFCRDYFKNVERRNPTLTEIKVIDTYWSDHCRHTTFLTKIEEVTIEEGRFSLPIKEAYEEYQSIRKQIYKDNDKIMSLMDIATIAVKELRKKGLLEDLDESDEINACSIEIDVDVDEKMEKWLLMFKNETHNHPTEIEPFGGAATCLGGAIRDPLSGRAYVYQAMRVSGSGDARTKIEDTIPGKLPQRKITIGAAQGYSSYGNQIGLATGQVSEVYHDGFVAKRMELGAVIGAVPKANVVREKPISGDVVILIGGMTGRDGCGGATGSSKEHDETSILTCGSEVQKGNPVVERKIQRLFRNSEVSRRIKKCNDFGAGGVSVAIGELAEGLDINLDLVPKKYEGLDGTELAIAESQERMAVVAAKGDADILIALCLEENLEATVVAVVTEEKRLRMSWRGNYIVDISRDFLDTNGVIQLTDVVVKAPKEEISYFNTLEHNESFSAEALEEKWGSVLKQLNIGSQKGLVERFDSSIGGATVLMPFGGKYQDTPPEGMAAKLPVLNGETTTASLMTYGYNPTIGKWSPFHGAIYSVVEAVAKIAALGGDYKKIRLSLQEYFEKLGKDPVKWGKPFSALLGALKVQRELGIAAIGGKDSMSGTFKDIDVPPTLVAFAVSVEKVENILSPEFKKAGSKVVLAHVPIEEDGLPNFKVLKRNYDYIKKLVDRGAVLSACSIRGGGICEAVSKMCFGNRIGFKFNKDGNTADLFKPNYGSIILELENADSISSELDEQGFVMIGETIQCAVINVNKKDITLEKLYDSYTSVLEEVFPTKSKEIIEPIESSAFHRAFPKVPASWTAKPRIFIPVFPGTNCEYDSRRAFEKAGGCVNSFVFKNLTSAGVEESINEIVKNIKNAQIVMLPGGFSAGDEPDGSGKFITAVFRNERVKEAVQDLLNNRDGLMLGICNGFQALIKLGLVPYGHITEPKEQCPTLTFNSLGRHVSKMVKTKVVSNLSPWLSKTSVGDIHTIPVSHGEGRFVCSQDELERLLVNGQIATQYVDFEGNPTYNIEHNPNGSYYAVEAITSPDGRILGKMGHSERIGYGVAKNVPGNKDQKLFKAGVEYFK